jgi:copper chaperone CopZ
MRHLHLVVDGMSCRRCVREVTSRLRDVPGVKTVSANPADCTVHLSGDFQLKDVLDAFAGTTYRPHAPGPIAAASDQDSDRTESGKAKP